MSMSGTSSSRAQPTLHESRDSSAASQISFRQRPGYGSTGKVVQLQTNSCRIVINDEALGNVIYQYSVEIRLENTLYENPKYLNRMFWEIVEENKQHFPAYQVVYDDRKNLYSLKQLKQDTFIKKFGKNNEFTLSMTLNKLYQFHLNKICTEQQRNFLNALLTQAERCNISKEAGKFYVCRDKMFLVPKEDSSRVHVNYLGKGLEMWYALHSLVNISENCEAIVNYDRVCGSFLKMKMPILDYYLCYINQRPRPQAEDFAYFERMTFNDRQRQILKDNLKGLGLVASHGTKRHYKFYDVTNVSARNSFFEWQNKETGVNEQISVEEYFFKSWGIRLQLPHFPLIQVAPPAKKLYIPMELLMISDRPQRFPRQLPEECVREALKKNVATISPRDRFNYILRLLKEVQINDDSKFMRKAGVQVNQRLMSLEGRVLPLPKLTVNEGKQEFAPDKTAAWPNSAVQSNTRRPTIFACLLDYDVRQQMDERFFAYFNALMDACRAIGVRLYDQGHFRPICEVFRRDRDELRNIIKRLYNRVGNDYGDDECNRCEFLILYVAHEKNDYNYADLKATCELELKCFSQVVLAKTYSMLLDPRKSPAKNIALKINAKLGGVTTAVMPRQQEWSKFISEHEPTLFIGVDSSYTRKEGETSLYAVSGSVNLEGTKYQTTIIPMSTISGYTDQAVDLTAPMQTSLTAFYQGTGFYPRHVIIYRLGVTNSQRDNAANSELKSIFLAVKELVGLAETAYDPTLTYISIERNHQNRFHFDEHSVRMPSGYAVGNQGNVPAGTVVEKVITKAHLFDFFLCSHHGALGTSRPTHYIVYYDDWRLNADEIQMVTFCLCFLISNCTRSISLPAPAYYASKGCERGKKYINSCILNPDNLDFPPVQPYEALPIPKSISTTMYMI